MRVSAHLHLPKMKAGIKEMISVKPGNDPTHYVSTIGMKDVDFHINKSGQARAVREKKRNVHAWVRGTETNDLPFDGSVNWKTATYNPFRNETFVDTETGQPVLNAQFAYMLGKRVFYVA